MGWFIFWTIVITISVGIYLTDRKGWNATAKRLSTIVRAHLESSKPLKKIEKKNERDEKDSWTAEFEGKTFDDSPNHVIVKTWFAKFNDTLRPYYKCKCGYSNWNLDISDATRDSQKHVREQNAADERLKRNGGTHAW